MNEDDIDQIIITTKSLWKSQTYKLHTSALKKTLSYIRKTLDYNKLITGGYSYQTLVKLCGNSIIRYPAIAGILTYNDAKDSESTKFITNIEYNVTKLQKIKSIVKSGKLPYIKTSSTECLNLIYDIINSSDLKTKTPHQLFNDLHFIYKNEETYVGLNILTDYLAYFISEWDQDKANTLQKKYREHIQLNKDTADIIFSRESLWKKELVNHLRKINSDRLDKTSAYPEVTLRKILARDVLLFRYLEKYISQTFKNVPTSIDSLQWFFNTCSIKALKKALVFIANHYVKPDNDRVKSKHTKHHCNDFIKTTIVLLRDRMPNYLFCKKDLHTLNTGQLLSQINNEREVPVESVRRHFYDGEVRQIMEDVENDSRYTLIFTILKEVGLRIGAIVTLRVKHFLNHKGEYLKNCRKLEKGKKYRTFPISDNLQDKVKLYLEDNLELKKNLNSYLFPGQNGNHISTDTVRDKLTRVTQSLGIYGQHVHPHAFRHTIVNDLMAKGNKLENVSKYMGHSSIATTEHFYWTTELENIIPTMNIPWLKGSKSVRFAYPEDLDDEELDRKEDNDNLSTDLLVSVIGVYHSVMDDKQKETIKERIPNIEDIFKNICEYSMASSLASRRSIEENGDSVKDYI